MSKALIVSIGILIVQTIQGQIITPLPTLSHSSSSHPSINPTINTTTVDQILMNYTTTCCKCLERNDCAEDKPCIEFVCASDPYCCENQWDSRCDYWASNQCINTQDKANNSNNDYSEIFPTKSQTNTITTNNSSTDVMNAKLEIVVDNETVSMSLILDNELPLIHVREIERIMVNITKFYIRADCGYIKQSVFDSNQTNVIVELLNCHPSKQLQLLNAVSISNLPEALETSIYNNLNLNISVDDVVFHYLHITIHSSTTQPINMIPDSIVYKSGNNNHSTMSLRLLITVTVAAVSCCLWFIVMIIKVLAAEKRAIQKQTASVLQSGSLETEANHNIENEKMDNDGFEIII